MPGKRLCTRLSLDDFLSFSGPTGIILEPDDTRSNFFLHLGLQERNYRHRLIYRRMKREAKCGMERLYKTRKCLQPELVDDESVQAPFNLSQITEFAFQRQVEKIYETASQQAKGIYDITRANDGSNWVIRWMLWQVIQARLRRHESCTNSSAETEYSIPSTCTDTTATSFSIPTFRTDQSSPVYWASPLSPHDHSDRGAWDENDVKMITDRYVASRKPATPRSGFWDHVMNNT